MQGKIVKVSGPLIVAENMADSKMYDVVKVSELGLIGEIIELRGDRASIQVYEETGGLGVGESVESTGEPLSVELAPGLIEGIFDGIQRPLTTLCEKYGSRIGRGVKVTNLDHEKLWHFVPKVKVGDVVEVPGIGAVTILANGDLVAGQETAEENNGVVLLPERVVFTAENVANYPF